jgi:hypothetical protein
MRNYRVDLTFSSSVQKIGGQYEIRNEVKSLTPKQAVPFLKWDALPYGPLPVIAAVGGHDSLFSKLLGGIIGLLKPTRVWPELPVPGGEIPFQSTSLFIRTDQPTLKYDTVWISSNSGQRVVGAEIPYWSPDKAE